ncbi:MULTISPECIES: hypothetical protein [unclassified Streptomyces]|uniref:hypothetical protein n=1 Tax=unclassified Streptomyces TaxID=2593676 RepID=UPI0007F9D70A|nr:hypothetical protein [Streptomyces sp. SAT1]ANO42289.1 hypothetical protein A8713_034090 [Streptomyces sp. SAT1]
MSDSPVEAMKRSSTLTYDGIHRALTDAQRTLAGVDQAVDGIESRLASGYGGDDGIAFLDMVRRWHREFQRINAATARILLVVEHSSQTDAKTLHANMEGVSALAGANVFDGGSHHASNSYDTMMG